MFLTFTFTANGEKISREVNNLFDKIYVVIYSILSNELKGKKIALKGILLNGNKINAEDNFASIMANDGDDIMVLSEFRGQNTKEINEAKIIGSHTGMDSIKKNTIFEIVKIVFNDNTDIKTKVNQIFNKLDEKFNEKYNVFIYQKNCGNIKYASLNEELFIEINGYYVSIFNNEK